MLLRLAGCDEMQGFLFAKPRPAEAIDKIALRSGRDRDAPAPLAALDRLRHPADADSKRDRSDRLP